MTVEKSWLVAVVGRLGFSGLGFGVTAGVSGGRLGFCLGFGATAGVSGSGSGRWFRFGVAAGVGGRGGVGGGVAHLAQHGGTSGAEEAEQ